jgi:hypothetical protein
MLKIHVFDGFTFRISADNFIVLMATYHTMELAKYYLKI